MRDTRQRLHFGGLFRANRPAQLILRLTVLDEAGRAVRQMAHPIALGLTFRATDLSLPSDLARERIARVRLDIEPVTPGARFMMDELYVIAR
jgi:hypothetical protein